MKLNNSVSQITKTNKTLNVIQLSQIQNQKLNNFIK